MKRKIYKFERNIERGAEMKKIRWILVTSVVLLFSSVMAMAQTVPEKVQQYAEGKAFDEFLEIAGQLKLNTSANIESLALGEGFPVHIMTDELFTAEKFSALIGDEIKWLYLINEPDGKAVSFLEIYDLPEEGLSSGGGGDSLYFCQAVQKMRELIHKYGTDEDFQVVSYGYDDYFLFYSFGGDERVIYANPIEFNETYLDVKDYRELPTGEEALAAIREEQQIYRQQIEGKDNLSFSDLPLGGNNLQLSLHKQSSLLPIVLIGLVVILPLLLISVVMYRRKLRKREQLLQQKRHNGRIMNRSSCGAAGNMVFYPWKEVSCMKTGSKWLVILMLLSLLLCACGKQQESSAATEESTGYAHSINSTDWDRNFAPGFAGFAVCSTEDTLYYAVDPARAYGAWIWFSDRKTGISMPLCGKADCSHSGSTCNSYFSGKLFCLSAYDGKLFWLGHDQIGVFNIYSCNPDGTGREEYAIENNELLQSITSGMTAFIHRGYAYFYGECSVVKNGEPSMESTLVRCPVRGGAAETVAYESYDGATFTAQAYQDSIYLVCTKYRDNEGYEIEITQIDSTTLDKKSLYRGESSCVNNMGVTENGIFLSCVDANKLYFFDFAEQKITVPFNLDPEDAYLRQLEFGSDRIIATQRTDTFDVLVTDFKGNTLLQKSYELEISKQMKDWVMYIGRIMGIDQDNVYINIIPMSKDVFTGLMRFPLDGSDPVVLWSDNN